MPAITSIVNVHAEGSMARPAIESMLDAVDFAIARGVDVQTLVIADRVTRDTIEAIRPCLNRLQIEHINVGDPGLARNAGTELATGEYVSFFDGDDLVGNTWLYEAFVVARKNPKNIVHPHLFVVFGDRATQQHIAEVTPITAGQTKTLVFRNLLPVVHLSRRSTCLAVPYRKSDLSAGFGYEDWTWNRETIQAGYTHVTAPRTIFFNRRKLSGSVAGESVRQKCLPIPSPRFFKQRGSQERTRPQMLQPDELIGSSR
jgi:glycosyltransferase involved in cell wall biosynthesis